jgi:hypothetical protein
MGDRSKKQDATQAGQKKPKAKVKKKEQPCPLQKKKKIKLVELVEVVTRAGTEGTVVGAAPASAEKAKLVDRTEKNGGAYKQFINLDKDIEEADKRHPEFGRFVELKARVEWKDGKKTELQGKKVHWSFKLTKKGDKRDSQLKTGETDLDSSENAYFEGGTGPKKDKLITDTNDDGWTNVVKFHLSKYGGDQYTVSAQADEKSNGTASGKKLDAGSYEVWRRFWYQLTHESKFNAPKPKESVKVYEKVMAEMVLSETKKFDKNNLTEAVRKRTFYSEYMVKKGGGNDKVAVIGKHNKKPTFYNMFNAEKAKPVKAHVIVCQYQCDPKGESESLKKQMSSKTKNLTVTVNSGEFICKPALKDDLVSEGEWSVNWPPETTKYKNIKTAQKLKKPNKTKGTLDDDNISIPAGRSDVNVVKVKLPDDAPDPALYEVYVKLTFRVGKGYLGESAGHQILTVYDDSDEPDYNDTITHEIGHTFNQTPDASAHAQPKSLKDHPKWHTNNYGGSGDHCSTGATLKKDSDVDEKTTSGKYWDEGTCVMYLGYSSKCKHKFCDVCLPYVRLQDMSTM